MCGFFLMWLVLFDRVLARRQAFERRGEQDYLLHLSSWLNQNFGQFSRRSRREIEILSSPLLLLSGDSQPSS